MSVTEYDWCRHCEARREMVMTTAGVLACCVCDAVNT